MKESAGRQPHPAAYIQAIVSIQEPLIKHLSWLDKSASQCYILANEATCYTLFCGTLLDHLTYEVIRQKNTPMFLANEVNKEPTPNSISFPHFYKLNTIRAFCPSSQLIQRSPWVRKQATAWRARWWIHPSCVSWVMMASLNGAPDEREKNDSADVIARFRNKWMNDRITVSTYESQWETLFWPWQERPMISLSIQCDINEQIPQTEMTRKKTVEESTDSQMQTFWRFVESSKMSFMRWVNFVSATFTTNTLFVSFCFWVKGVLKGCAVGGLHKYFN